MLVRKKQLQKFLKYDLQTGIFYNRKSKKVVGKTDFIGKVSMTGKITPAGHVWIWVDKNKYRADKLAWLYVYGYWPKHDIIHINGLNHNNWIDNLRKPRKLKRKDNKSKIPGVYRDKKNKKWRAQIALNNKQKSLGSYKNFDNAVLARFKAEQVNGFPAGSSASRYVKKMFM